MKILNPAVTDDLRQGRPLALNLGAGLRARPGDYSVDHLELPGIDVVADLGAPLSALPDNCAGAVFSNHVLEHVPNFLGLLSEIHRITQPDGLIEIVVPHFSNPYHYSDPTHVRTFGLYSFFYFADEGDQPRRKVPNFYLPIRFRVEEVGLRLLTGSIVTKPLVKAVNYLVNRGLGLLDWYERRLCRFLPAESIRYVLRPIKAISQRAAA
ncbi:MAG: methyltransferase domain-containing protein [Gemmataceae bacterium]